LSLQFFASVLGFCEITKMCYTVDMEQFCYFVPIYYIILILEVPRNCQIPQIVQFVVLGSSLL